MGYLSARSLTMAAVVTVAAVFASVMIDQKQTHYQRLRVPYDAEGDEIKKAYRKRAQLLHPDKLRHSQSTWALAWAYTAWALGDTPEHAFSRLVEARDCLLEPECRQQHDQRVLASSASSPHDRQFGQDEYYGPPKGVLGSSWSIGQIWWALVIGVLLFDSFLPALFRGVPRCFDAVLRCARLRRGWQGSQDAKQARKLPLAPVLPTPDSAVGSAATPAPAPDAPEWEADAKIVALATEGLASVAAHGDRAVADKALSAVHVILTNVINNPREVKFRRLRSTNKRIAGIMAVPGISKLLFGAGFAPAFDFTLFELRGDTKATQYIADTIADTTVRGRVGLISTMHKRRN